MNNKIQHTSRLEEWIDFCHNVVETTKIIMPNKYFVIEVGHFIHNQTIPRYGDLPDDLASNWTADTCLQQIEKYKRREKQEPVRTQDPLWDTFKRAHHCYRAFFSRVLQRMYVLLNVYQQRKHIIKLLTTKESKMVYEINLDVPSGKEYLVNKTIRVCTAGRIVMEYPTYIDKVEEDKQSGGDVCVHVVGARHDLSLVLRSKNLEEVAYQLLGIAAKYKNKGE